MTNATEDVETAEYREEVTSQQADNEDRRRRRRRSGDWKIKGHINSKNRDLRMTEADSVKHRSFSSIRFE